MSGNVLITGASGGIGLEMTQALAGRADKVVVTGRSPDKLQTAVSGVNKHAGGNVEAAPLDLGNLDSVRAFANRLPDTLPRIDLLILNAGLYTRRLHRLDNGFEAMIGVMHLGHFLLTNLLLEQLLVAQAPRVVVTSSALHKNGRIDFDSFTNPKRHRIGVFGYAQAKLANLLFARELARRYGGRGLIANAFHPGAVATGVWRELPPPLPWLTDKLMSSPAEGSDTGTWLATSEAAGEFNGQYCVGRRARYGSSVSRDPELAADLWTRSEQLCGLV